MSLLTLLGVWIVAILSPGPDVVAVICSATRDRRAGVYCALGVMTGNTLWITASLVGVSALIIAHPAIFPWLQLIGASFLAYMGVMALRSGLRGRGAGPAPGVGQEKSADTLAAWRTGLTVNLANPKALVFFGAVFTQFIDPDLSWGWTALVGILLILTGIAWFAGLALAVRAVAARLLRSWWLLDALAGTAFLLIALVMLIEGVRGLL